MPAIPLQNRLKKRSQVKVAMLQDELVEILYSVDDRLVLHGGTAIWRCYGGNRFSEDIDLYGLDPGRVTAGVREAAAGRGLSVVKAKATRNLLYLKVRGNESEVRVEVNLAAPAGTPVVESYERADGTRMDILTLSAEDLVKEKIQAYRTRRLIRDIYDIHHLLPLVEDRASLRPLVAGLLQQVRMPADESNLKTLVYSGVAPSFSQILASIKRLSR